MLVIGFVILAFFTIILVSWIVLLKRRSEAGIGGWVKDSDLKGEGRKYVDQATGIVAKPDIVLKGKVIEVKSYPVKNKPLSGDILQAAAEMNAVGVGKAEIHYLNRKFRVENTLHLRDALMRVFHAMKEHLDLNMAPHGTPTKGRCRVCEFNDICSERC